MRIIKNNITKIPKSDFNIATIGSFDGIHIGHKKILQTLTKIAKKNNGKSILITFWPHPRYVLKKNNDFKLLTSLDEKIKLFEKNKIDILYIVDFSLKFSKVSANKFIENILLEKLKINCLLIGYNNNFGRNREGNIRYLEENKKKFDIDIISIPKQSVDKISISSTKIREYLNNGKINSANRLLGRKYSINGKIVKGNGIGRKINFPTANIEIDEPKKLLPKSGVYAVEVILNRKIYLGMLNIGYNPTIKNEKKSIEVNIFEFSEDIYNNKISINFIRRIRNEKKFKNLNELKKQLIKDKKKVKSI
mgnify:CR=1 FL=1|tara:strand:+ start:247 stop:1167 length:921 start_codon:yes stop_codon:yes gene_type:complete